MRGLAPVTYRCCLETAVAQRLTCRGQSASRSRACVWPGLGCSERSVAGAPGGGFPPALPQASPSTPACSPHEAGVGWGQKLPTGDAQKRGGLAFRGSRSGRTLCPLHRLPLARPLGEGPCHTVVCVHLPPLERLTKSPALILRPTPSQPCTVPWWLSVCLRAGAPESSGCLDALLTLNVGAEEVLREE